MVRRAVRPRRAARSSCPAACRAGWTCRLRRSRDEQPIDAAALAEAEVEAFAATGDQAHAHRAILAFEWFLGANKLGEPVYDFATGGCRDGVGSEALNLNEGAESTLAFLQAIITIDASGVGASIAAP